MWLGRQLPGTPHSVYGAFQPLILSIKKISLFKLESLTVMVEVFKVTCGPVLGNSLAVQWFGHGAFTAGTRVQSLVWNWRPAGRVVWSKN